MGLMISHSAGKTSTSYRGWICQKRTTWAETADIFVRCRLLKCNLLLRVEHEVSFFAEDKYTNTHGPVTDFISLGLLIS